MEELSIYFVRHGETFFNLNKRTQGWCDPFLTPNGINQVRQIGKGLSQIKFDGVIVSDLKRTHRTAEIIIEESNFPNWTIPMKEMSEFREISFGSFEGAKSLTTWEKLTEYFGFIDIPTMLENTTEVERLSALRSADPTHQAEDYDQYCQRIDEGIEKLLSEFSQTNAKILFVGHSINIRYILQQLIPKKDQLSTFKDMRSLSNGGVTIIQYKQEKFELLSYNDLSFVKNKFTEECTLC